jgi:glutathione S-transferase
MSDGPVVLWQMQPAWGLPNPSPFCMKVETWLRMAQIPYVTKALQSPPKSRSKKVPYIERPDGTLLADSSAIIETLRQERGVTLDDGLSEDDRALGVLLQRTFEEDLYFIVLFERWAIRDNWKIVEPAYFGTVPWIIRRTVVPFVRRGVLASAYGQGVARLDDAQRHRKAEADLAAVSRILGTKEFFFERRSSYDAIGYAFLANIIYVPIASPTADAARTHENLVRYCERMQAAYSG